ncbi:MAG: oligopeptide transporter, OPT family, partial [Phycisphaerae bacterium]|nr:oligopeptide transporter, OPT family [Phycisphaerae bacterium]
MRELSPLAIFLGIIIGILFGAANAYIGMKVGMTVSASIPAAVISMAVLRGILKRGTIGENNIVQTIGSTGESLAAGMIFTIPALFVFALKDADDSIRPDFWEMAVWGAVGGLIGVIFMVPLRRMLIVREHGKLPFPEGTACAEVLESGQQGGSAARTVFAGLGVGALYELFRGLGFWRDNASLKLPYIKTELGLAAEPALLGVGYILGIRIAGYMLAGAVLGWFVIIPAIGFFGGPDTILAPAEVAIGQMDPGMMWDKYLRFIGAGAVVLGGLISLFKSFGTIGGSIFHMVGGNRTGQRTDRDIPTIILLLLLGAVGATMWFAPEYGLMHKFLQSIPVIACVLVFGFFFVTVSSRLVGIVGSSSNPASGMTIATLLGTALILVYGVGLEGPAAKITIISVGALVCIAICIAGDCSQDLKTGYLLKATPWKQQLGEIIGVLAAAAALAGVIWICSDRYGFLRDASHPNALLAPQANLMQLLVQGIVDKNLPWPLIFIGMACALVVEFLGIPSLPFAVGLYLPLSLSTPIMVGGLVRWLVTISRRKATSEAHDPGILASSGLVAGHGLMGVILVGAAALIGFGFGDPRFAPPRYNEQGQRWGQLDKASGLFVYEDENMGGVGFQDEESGAWVTYDKERGVWGYESTSHGWTQWE